MSKGVAHIWTREQLERVMETAGRAAHEELAEELGVSANTVYSTRSRVRVTGGIDEFLEKQGRMADYGTKVPMTLSEQLDRVYLIRISATGRDGNQPQFTVTIPPILAQKFMDTHGREIRYVPKDDGILIIPVPRPETNGLPEWATD